MSKTADKPQVLLEHHLKALKLPTILAEYEKVARESAVDGIDHPRYLLRLVELELPGSRQAAYLKFARLRARSASAGWSTGASVRPSSRR